MCPFLLKPDDQNVFLQLQNKLVCSRVILIYEVESVQVGTEVFLATGLRLVITLVVKLEYRLDRLLQKFL